MRTAIDQLRPVTALRLLEIWQTQRECGGDGLERCILCNAQVIAECCFSEGKPVFADQWEVLRSLTAREMEDLLRRLSGGGSAPGEENPGFDLERFRRLGEG